MARSRVILRLCNRILENSTVSSPARSLPSIPRSTPSTTRPVIDCSDLLAFGGEGNEDEVEMFMSVMDPSDMPGMGSRAIVFAVLPRGVNEIGSGRNLRIDALEAAYQERRISSPGTG